jgi:hypothetical protein
LDVYIQAVLESLNAVLEVDKRKGEYPINKISHLMHALFLLPQASDLHWWRESPSL